MILPSMMMVAALLAGDALAQGPRLVALDGALGNGVPPVLERLLGEDAGVNAIFLRPDGADVVLMAEVHLSGGSLAAPLLRGLPFQPMAVSSHPALLEGSFTLPHPATDKPVTQVVLIQATSGGHQQARVGSFLLRWVSPMECRDALVRALSADDAVEAPKLIVFGTLPGLREQLRQWQIRFEEAGTGALERIEGRSLAIGDGLHADDPLPALANGSSLFLVRLQKEACAEVLRKDTPGRRLTEVTVTHVQDWRRSALLIRHLTTHLTPSTP